MFSVVSAFQYSTCRIANMSRDEKKQQWSKVFEEKIIVMGNLYRNCHS